MKWAIKISPIVLLAGCMVGPNYQAPQSCMPEKFIESCSVETDSACDSDYYHWWEQLNDPILNCLLTEAVQGNFDFGLALERIVQARSQFRVESSYLWPEIDLNASATRTRNSENFFSAASAAAAGTTAGATSSLPLYQNFFLIGFDAIWELDFWGKFRRAKRAAYDQWEAANEDAQNVLISILSEVAVNYVSIRALQQKIKLTHQKIGADEEEIELAQDLFQAGLDSEIQLDNLIATVENDKATLPVLAASLKQTIYALAVLLGKQPECLLKEFEEIGPVPSGSGKIPIGIPSDLLRRRPDIKEAERKLAAATEQIGVAVADLFPHISLTGSTIGGGSLIGSSYGYQSRELSTLFSPMSKTWSVGPNIRWDLIDFGRTRGNIAIQNSLQRQALLTYEKTVITALQDVEGALAAYCEEQRRNVFLKDQTVANQRALELTEDLFNAGLASELQVLEARRTWIDSENIFVDSEQALTSDLIAVYKALGGNWECSYSP